MVRRNASKSRSRSTTRRSGGGVKKRGGNKAGAFLNFVRSMRNLFPNHTPARLKQDSKALWREMNPEDKSMYSSSQQMCGPGRMGRRRSRSRRSRSRSRSRSRRRRSRSRSRRRRPG